MNDPRNPRHDGAAAETIESVLTAGAVVLMLASILFLALLISTAFSAPRVGDILAFKQGARVADVLTVTARRADATGPDATRVPDPEGMVQDGGSVVVEGNAVTGESFRVHWAGGKTAAGTPDCGRSAELIVSKPDLQSLINAMGGRGMAGRGLVF